jgi:hypothetical protein
MPTAPHREGCVSAGCHQYCLLAILGLERSTPSPKALEWLSASFTASFSQRAKSDTCHLLPQLAPSKTHQSALKGLISGFSIGQGIGKGGVWWIFLCR